MNKLLLTSSFLISLICLSSHSWALPACPSSGYFHNCFGIYTTPNGGRYIGEFQNDKYHGQGAYTFVNSDKYIGEYKNGKKHGQGTYTFPDGDKYVGEFKNGKYNGQGSYYFLADNVNKGDVYTGEHKDNKKHGQGTYIFKNGQKYKGQYKNGKRHGQGTYTFVSGNKYVGEYKNGKRHGQGTYTYKNGEKDVGEFQNGKLNGFAIGYDKYGTILKKGIWKDDKFLYTQKKSTSSSSNFKLDKYKSFCGEIGFTPGTEKFGDCVLEAMKKG